MTHEKLLHFQKVVVQREVWFNGAIGPYYFSKDEGQAEIVYGESCRSMITDNFWHEIKDIDLDDLLFQQDGATGHIMRVMLDDMQQKFRECIISHHESDLYQ